MSEDHPLYEKVWSYAPGKEDIDIEIGENILWNYDDDLEKFYEEEALQLTLTREEAKQLVKDLQEWLNGEM